MRINCRVIAIIFFVFLGLAYADAPLPSHREYDPPKGKGRVVVVVSGQKGPATRHTVAEDFAEQGCGSGRLFDGRGRSLNYATQMPELVSAVVVYYPVTYDITNPDNFVSKIKVPTLMFAGVRDTYKDCCRIETARKLADATKKSEGKVMLEVFEYPDAGHGFIIKSSKAWSPTDAADAFRRTLSHLRQYSGE